MKNWIFFLILLFLSKIAFGQLTMKVDSIDISKNIKVAINEGEIILPLYSGYPILHIVATVTNNTDNNILLYDNIFPSEIWLDYRSDYRYYHEKLLWIQTSKPISNEYMHDIYLPPNKSEKLLFFTYMSDYSLFNDSKAIRWKWERDPIADSEYIDWLKGILPTIKIIIDYGQRSKEIKRLVSEPINLETLKITTNLKDERVN